MKRYRFQPMVEVVFVLASDFISLSKAAEMLGVSHSTLYRYEKAGLINAYRTVGGHRRYSVEEITSFLERMKRGDFFNPSQSLKKKNSNNLGDKKL